MDNENNRGIAILFSLLGGLIGTIPWILIYVYGNMIIAILAIFIAMAAWKGYNLAKGKVDKYVPMIIIIVSIVSVTIATFIFIPALLLLKEGSHVTMEAVKELYEYNTFTAGITRDYFISLLFTIMGISGVITNMKNQIRSGNKVNLMNYSSITEEEKEIVYSAFSKFGAFNKDNTISQKEIIDNIDNDNKEILFMKFISQGIIKNYKGKYYYNEEVAKNPGKVNSRKILKTIGLILLIVVIISITMSMLTTNKSTSNTNDYQNENIEYNEINQDNQIRYLVPSNWVELENYRKDNIYYYAPSIDKTGYSGIISVRYGVTDYGEYEEFKNAIEDAFMENPDGSLISNKINEFTNELGYKVVEIVAVYDDETYPSTEYMYYIFGDYTYGLVYLTDYYSKYVKDPKDVAYMMVNKFDFIKGEVSYE